MIRFAAAISFASCLISSASYGAKIEIGNPCEWDLRDNTVFTGDPLPADEASLQYSQISWQIPSEQPLDVIEVQQAIRTTDKVLWEQTIKQGKKELGVFEAFDTQGSRLDLSEVVIGERHAIPDVKPLFKAFLKNLDENHRFSVATIQFTHSHPHTGLTFANGLPAIAMPEFLSPGDIKSGSTLRAVLNEMSFDHVDFIMTAITKKEVTVGDLIDQGSIGRAIKLLMKGPRFLKSSVVYPRM